MLAVVGLVASPVSSQADLVDPGLDTIMQVTPAGFHRAERDRLPKGPMTAATFNTVGVTAVPVRADNAVFYGASYERLDGALIVFLGMSSSHQADGQGFADGVIEGTLTDGKPISTGVAGVAGVEGESNGVRAVVVAFARNGRGFAVMSFGENAADDGAGFVKFVVGLAESTPTRSDAKPAEKLQPVAVGIAAFSALAIVGFVALWRFARRRGNGSRGVGPTTRPGPHTGQATLWGRNTSMAETLEHPVQAGPRHAHRRDRILVSPRRCIVLADNRDSYLAPPTSRLWPNPAPMTTTLRMFAAVVRFSQSSVWWEYGNAVDLDVVAVRT